MVRPSRRRSARSLRNPATWRVSPSSNRTSVPASARPPRHSPSARSVGRLSVWNGHSSADHLERSRYERVLMSAVAGRPLRLLGARYTPVHVHGWSRVALRRDDDASEIVVPIDALVECLDEWERGR